MPPKSRNAQTHTDDRLEQRSSRLRLVLALIVSVSASIYVGWFLSYPVLAGMQGADGEPMSRLLYLSRIMLPELWWNEMTGGGRLPLGFLDRWPVALWVTIWLAVAFALGRPLVRLAFRDTVPREQNGSWSLTWVEMVSLAMLAGLAILSTATLLVGLAGGSAGRSIVLVIGVMLAAAGAFTFPMARSTFTHSRWLPEGAAPNGVFGQLAGRLVVVLTIVLAVTYGLGSMMPPFEFDVVEYHLQSPKEFYQLGHIGFNDHNIYANMPLGLEMHSLAAMSVFGGSNVNEPDNWWLGGLIGKAVIGAHSLIAALLIGGFVARKTDSRWIGWGAAGLWLSVPGNAQVATSGLIDAALGTYILASLVVVTELWRRLAERNEDEANSSAHNGALHADEGTVATFAEQKATMLRCNTEMRSSQWLVLLIFIYAGAAAAAKYPGLIYAVLPCMAAIGAALFMVPKVSRLTLAKQWVVPAICGLSLTCAPWYVKNAVLTGNPVYPLGYSVFGGKNLDPARAEQWSKAHRVPAYSVSALADSAKQVLVASDATQPMVLFLAMCGLLGPPAIRHAIRHATRRAKRTSQFPWKPAWSSQWAMVWLACSVWILLVWWLATHRIDRFWLPAVSIWAVLAGVGLARLVTRVSHGLATALVLFGLAYGIVINASPAAGDNRYFVSLEGLRSDGGDDENVGRLSRQIAWCNDNLPQAKTKLLLVGEARAFDFRMPIVYSTCFDISPVETWLRGKTAEQQRANLKAAGATHMLVNWAEIARYRNPGNYGFSDWPSREDIDELLDSGVVQRVEWPFAAEAAELYEVVSSEVP